MLDTQTIRERVQSFQTRLNQASLQNGFEGVTILGVTKTVAPEVVNLAYDAGIRHIGENRVQEALNKLPALNPNFHLHIIGQLQTNKVKYVMTSAHMIQSLDRRSLADEISRRAGQAGRAMPVLIQVNIGDEPQKAGVSEAELEGFARYASGLDGLSVKGLMAIMPQTSDPQVLRPLFRRMRAWFERLKGMPGAEMRHLSMGMSEDCILAAEEGATMVRIGSALFGPRPQL